MLIFSKDLIELYVPWKLFALGFYFELLKRGWVNIIEIDVQEGIIHLDLPQAVKQVLCVLNRKYSQVTCCMSSTIHEHDDIKPLQIQKILVGEPWYHGGIAEDEYEIGSNCLRRLQSWSPKDWTCQLLLKFGLVKKKHEELIREDCLTHIYDETVVIILKDYSVIHDRFFIHNKDKLETFLQSFEPENLA